MSRHLTRRVAVAAMAAAGAPAIATAAPDHQDTELIEFGRQFEEMTVALDGDDAEGAFDRLAVIEPAIVAMPATTIEGMRVKARAASWALMGDLEPTGPSTDVRMALSIVRDLIRLYDPDRERPNAVGDLLAEIERDATKS
jgi:hypothetical protein